MVFCGECGLAVRQLMNYCPECGTKVVRPEDRQDRLNEIMAAPMMTINGSNGNSSGYVTKKHNFSESQPKLDLGKIPSSQDIEEDPYDGHPADYPHSGNFEIVIGFLWLQIIYFGIFFFVNFFTGNLLWVLSVSSVVIFFIFKHNIRQYNEDARWIYVVASIFLTFYYFGKSAIFIFFTVGYIFSIYTLSFDKETVDNFYHAKSWHALKD